jgi:hypothetical protein
VQRAPDHNSAELHQLLPLLLAQRRRPARNDGSDLAFYSVHGL